MKNKKRRELAAFQTGKEKDNIDYPYSKFKKKTGENLPPFFSGDVTTEPSRILQI